jgi:hypothetical protein
MFKKIAIIYSGIMFVMLFVVMMLLISVMLLDINSTNELKIAELSLDEENDISLYSNEDIKTHLIIETDKDIYTPDEAVLISLKNTGTGKIAQNSNSNLTIKSRTKMGKNYDTAFIERQNGGDWIAIEPVNRCSENCFEPCIPEKQLFPNNQESFVWEQTVVECLDDSKQVIKKAPTGTYRIVTAAWNDDTAKFEKVHSNIFQISNLSKN